MIWICTFMYNSRFFGHLSISTSESHYWAWKFKITCQVITWHTLRCNLQELRTAGLITYPTAYILRTSKNTICDVEEVELICDSVLPLEKVSDSFSSSSSSGQCRGSKWVPLWFLRRAILKNVLFFIYKMFFFRPLTSRAASWVFSRALFPIFFILFLSNFARIALQIKSLRYKGLLTIFVFNGLN